MNGSGITLFVSSSYVSLSVVSYCIVFFCVLRIPALGRFILLLDVAGNRARYLRIKSRLLMNGMPINWLLRAASVSSCNGALKND